MSVNTKFMDASEPKIHNIKILINQKESSAKNPFSEPADIRKIHPQMYWIQAICLNIQCTSMCKQQHTLKGKHFLTLDFRDKLIPTILNLKIANINEDYCCYLI